MLMARRVGVPVLLASGLLAIYHHMVFFAA